MRDLGWIEGGNLAYEHARYPLRDLYPPRDNQEMLDIAHELIGRKPDVIWLPSSVSATVMLKVTGTIPVVGAAVSDVVARGFAASLAHPGKNFTGISNFTWELGAKRFQLLHEMMPKLARVGVLMHPKNPNCIREHQIIEEAAQRVRVTVVPAMMEHEDQAAAAFAQLSKGQAEAVLITHYPLFQSSRKAILKLAHEQRLPAVGHRTYFAHDGAVLAYSTVLDEQMRRSAYLVDKILKGTPAGDIPIEQPTKFELAVNRAKAKEFGLIIPETIRVQASHLID
ncbi:MAG TPA: ABC transporter substrate-binding protein [Burkholderiales bacterium]|nr:ABC transporter substrate-binding protein [Burkholderiales bacterium]